MVAYCTKEDLLVGDIPLGGKYGDGTAFVQLAADEIDAQIGHLYITPIVILDPTGPDNRPSALILKKINQLLASGRIVLDMAAGGEDRSLHSYGKSMLDEALMLLKLIREGEIVLRGAEQSTEANYDENTAVSITQVDSGSMVEKFYTDHWAMPIPGALTQGVRPYDVERDVS